MNIKNETWQVEIDKAKDTVKLYYKGKKTPTITVTINEFCALGALVSQTKGAGQ